MNVHSLFSRVFEFFKAKFGFVRRNAEKSAAAPKNKTAGLGGPAVLRKEGLG
jgi:hypothetical protein